MALTRSVFVPSGPDGKPTRAGDAEITGYARDVLAAFKASRPVWNPAIQLRAATIETTRAYNGRVVYELLQNGHDRHDRTRRDGKVTIVVDLSEGDHGVLYVANAGEPFTFEGLTILCKYGVSDKVIGAGIGHKGVGFCSVLSVGRWPEIYSADPAGPPGNLDGYSFRFARPADFAALAGPDTALARLAAAEMPPLQVPVPAGEATAAVRDLAGTGHVTVVRLPLESAAGADSVLDSVARITGSDVPVMLFLERIGELTIEVRPADSSGARGADDADPDGRGPAADECEERHRPVVLTRHELPLGSSGQVRLAEVDLGRDGRFVTATVPVDGERLREAIAAEADRMEIPDGWNDWEMAEVAVAVPIEGELLGRIYTHLPLGEKAVSPFAGHLHAPFITNLDRTDVDLLLPLNAMFFDVAAEVCLEAAGYLTTATPPGTEPAARRRWVSDLACWASGLDVLGEAAERLDTTPLTDRKIVPVVPARAGAPGGFAGLGEVRCWPDTRLEVLTAARAADAGIRAVDPALGPARVRAWARMGDRLGCAVELDPEALADAAEVVARTIARPGPAEQTSGPGTARRRGGTRRDAGARRGAVADGAAGSVRPSRRDTARAGTWAAFYADLAALFSSDPEALQGRAVLVDDAGELRQANRPAPPGRRVRGRRVSAFLPAARDDTPVAIPAQLHDRLFYLHPLVAERLTGPVRSFLTGASGAVAGFDTHSLLDHVADVAATSESDRLHRDALRFVFNLSRAGQITERYDLKALGLRVPATSGRCVPATEAVFAAGWPGRHGEDVEAVIEEAAGHHSGLATLAGRLVGPGPDLLRRGETAADWAPFLTRLGVTDGLPLAGPKTVRVWGSMLRSGSWPLGGPCGDVELIRQLHLPEGISAQWAPAVAAAAPGDVAHPETPYVALTTPVWLTGQDVAGRLSPRGRAAFARLVTFGLTHWGAEVFETHWERDRTGNRDRHTLPTPLGAFVATAPWVPAAPRPGGDGFARAADLWFFGAGDGDAEPVFASLVARPVREALERSPKVLAAFRRAGLGLWGDPAHAARLVRHLGAVAAAGRVGPLDEDRFVRAYGRAWADVAVVGDTGLWAGAGASGPADGVVLVCRRGRSLTTLAAGDVASGGDGPVYLARPGEGLHLRLAEQLELAVISADADVDRLATLLAPVLDDRIRVLDATSLTVRVEPEADEDGPAGADAAGAESGGGGPAGELLVERFAWVALAVAAAADHGGGLTLDAGSFAVLAERLRRLRLRRYRHLDLVLDGHPTTLPAARHGLLPVPGDDSGGDGEQEARPADGAVLVPAGATLSGPILVCLAEDVASLAGRGDLTPVLRAAALELQATAGPSPEPDTADLARALRLSAAQVESTRVRLDEATEEVLERVYPFLAHWLGAPTAAAFADGIRAGTPMAGSAGLAEALTEALGVAGCALPLPAGDLVAAARAAGSLDELRGNLGVAFAAFNATLAALGPRYRTISHRDAHVQALASWVGLARPKLLDRLRWARLAAFDARTPQPDWATLAAFDWVAVPAAWDTTVDEADATLLSGLVDEALTARLGRRAPLRGPRLAPADATAAANRSRVLRAAPALALLARAWAAPRRLAVPAALAGEPAEMVALLARNGALDFRDLSDGDIAGWLAVLGAWPAGMPATADPAVAGVSAKQLEEAKSTEAKAKAERERKKRTLHVAGRDLDVGGDLAGLVGVLEDLLAANPKLAAAARRVRVPAELPAPRAGRPGGGGGAGRGNSDSRMSQAQRDGIGFAGEWFVFQWLIRTFPEANPASWVSNARRHVFGDGGDDSAGYDFRLERGRSPLLLEVKASTGDSGTFVLTDNEIRTAQRHRDRWRLVVVTYVFTPERMRIDQLANPYGPGGEHYRAEGDGLRFRYRLDPPR